MEKLRSSYKKYQSEIFAPNPRFVDPQKAAIITKMADNELEKMRSTQNYANYDEAVFYKQKFSKLNDIASKFKDKTIAEQSYHREVRQVVQNDFMGLRNQPSFQQAVPAFGGGQTSNMKPKSKSPLKQFFDEQEVKNSKKINFSNLISQDETPLRFGLRSVSRKKSEQKPTRKNEQQLRRLEQQNRRLRDRLNNQKNNHGIDEERQRQLKDKIRELDEENRKLRTEVSKSSMSDFYTLEEYEPYSLKVRENNIVKIHNKNLYLSDRMSQFAGGTSEEIIVHKKSSQVYYDNQSALVPQRGTARSQNYLPEEDLLNSSQSTIQTQFLNLENEQLLDNEKNQICRQKIAFFKKSMTLVKGPDFDIAFKRSDFNSQMDKLRLILYVNNKDSRRFNCRIQYEYDHQDFDIIVKKKLVTVEGRSQGREEIQIYLKNPSDLGSLINAKIFVGDRMKKIVVPALFIDFDSDYKYQFENIGYIERNLAQPLVIRPMSQFTTIDKTNNVLDLSRQYEQKYEVGKIYGKSKACKAVVKLTWKRGNKLKIQTCEEWRTLMGYLFLNAEETINN